MTVTSGTLAAMRSLVVVVLLAVFGGTLLGANGARAQSFGGLSGVAGGLGDLRLQLDTGTALEVATLALAPVLPTLDVLPAKAQALQLPADYAWVERDTRAFWYAAGAAAVTSLGAHVLIGIPVLVLSAGILGSLGGGGALPVITLVAALGIGGAYAFAESLVAALAATLVFNGMSEIYEGDYLTALMAHFTGNLVSTAVTSLTFGGGLLLFHGVGQLAEFTGQAGLTTLQIFSFLGAMPAVVIAGIALIAVPALVSAWALASSAHPRPGYEIDEDWQKPTAQALPPSREPAAQYAIAVPLPALP